LAHAREANTLASHSAGGGRLILKHSPTLGMNIVVGVVIDGQPAGSFAKGHSFDRAITPGRHSMSVLVNGRENTAARINLEVRSGETYAYVVKYRAGRVVLEHAATAH
jgi:hypothetical protein